MNNLAVSYYQQFTRSVTETLQKDEWIWRTNNKMKHQNNTCSNNISNRQQIAAAAAMPLSDNSLLGYVFQPVALRHSNLRIL